MLDATIKRQAYAAMDDASSFRLEVLPAGVQPATVGSESAIHLLATDDVDAMRGPVKLLAHLARTFFADKLTRVAPAPDTDGPVALYVVSELAELDDAYVEPLSEEGGAPRLGAVPSAAPTLRPSQQATLRLPDEDSDAS